MTSTATGCAGVAERLAEFGDRFEIEFARLLEPLAAAADPLTEAMRYSAQAPGKRLRPFLVTECCELVGGTFEQALPSAAAIECVHSFSLVHDDLPAMDNDDLRRGRPTNHKIFGEAVAILAGDALLTLAFELIAAHSPAPDRGVALVAELARATGWAGMIAGQAADVAAENLPPDLNLVRSIHERKTARLIAAACRMGAIAGGGDRNAIECLGEYGRQIGLAFQIADDLLDVTSSVEAMGKPVQKDIGAGKQTYPRCVGVDQSRAAGDDAIESAVGALAPFGDRARSLQELARFCMERKH